MRSGKSDDLVQRVELVEANPTYARVKFPDGRESNVALRDIARYPRGDDNAPASAEMEDFDSNAREASDTEEREIGDDLVHQDPNERVSEDVESPAEKADLRRSARGNKGVPPERFGNPVGEP